MNSTHLPSRPPKRRFTPLLVKTAAIFFTIYLFSRSATMSEWYMQNVYPWVAAALSAVSGIAPFSMYDVFIVIAVLWLIKRIVLLCMRKDGLREFLYAMVRFTTILVAWFYLGWGIAYFRNDFNSRCEIPKVEYHADRFMDFASRFVSETNNLYIDCGALDRKGIQNEIEQSYQQWHRTLKTSYPNGKRHPKPMLAESIYTKMGVSGYFGPFFNEIHVNNYSLDAFYPFTLAHEMAHQFGIALESEANLYAFIVCSGSNNDQLRYSAHISMLSYIMNDVYRFLPDQYNRLYSSIRPEIIAKLKENRTHWLSARNKTLSDVQDKAYDAYLKTNKIESGRENYSEVVALIVSCYDLLNIDRNSNTHITTGKNAQINYHQ